MCTPYIDISDLCLGQMVAFNYATTQLEATHVFVTLATHFHTITMHAMVSVIIFIIACSVHISPCLIKAANWSSL